MGDKLWTPDRDVDVGPTQRSVESCTREEMRLFEFMDQFARQHKIAVICMRCDKPFQGLNDGHAGTQAVFCQCREIRAVVNRNKLVV